jgi:hypothetical protein
VEFTALDVLLLASLVELTLLAFALGWRYSLKTCCLLSGLIIEIRMVYISPNGLSISMDKYKPHGRLGQ